MPPANPLATPSLVISGFVLAAAGFLALHQWIGRASADESEATDEELRHEARQNVRRRRGIILMGLIGLTASTGFWINPAASPNQARLVFAAWVVIGVLLLVLVALAGLDWLHLVAHARHHRQQLVDDRQALLQAIQHELNRRASRDDNGHSANSNPSS